MLIRSRCCHMFTSCLDTKGVEVLRNVQRRPTLRGLPIWVCPTGQQEFQCRIVTKVRGDMYCIDLFGRHKDAAIAQDRNIYVLLIHKAQHPHLLEAKIWNDWFDSPLHLRFYLLTSYITTSLCYASSYTMNTLWSASWTKCLPPILSSKRTAAVRLGRFALGEIWGFRLATGESVP